VGPGSSSRRTSPRRSAIGPRSERARSRFCASPATSRAADAQGGGAKGYTIRPSARITENRGAPVADEEGRVFLRGISSETYGLSELRRRQRAAPRVRRAGTVTDDATVGHSGDSDEGLSRTWWMLGPGDEPFLTQTLQVHFVELMPGGSNHGHGHQNEATFYILEGAGYEIHDGKRYDWEKDDFVIVHTDSVHRHFNASKTDRALALVIKAKATWMMLGLIQQGRSKPFEDGDSFEPPRDWSALWTPGATNKRKVVKKGETKW